ncbi:MAG: tRNA guanosine(34) transglycosylase Tgt [Candidatus Pacearchaeota archaeon]
MKFEILARNKAARLGKIKVAHGSFKTPILFPIATAGVVKALTTKQLNDIGIEAILANTLHLYLKSNVDFIARHGGLHKFMAWDKPIVTDSGGFQVFSLGFFIEHGIGKIGYFPGEKFKCKKELGKVKSELGACTKEKLADVDDDGVTFKSFIDGSLHRLTPEKSIEIQEKLGSDIMFAFDECTSIFNDYSYTKASLARTHAWALRSLEAKKSKNALFGIVQGGIFKDLRKQSAKFISSQDFDGIGIGGFLGRNKQEMQALTKYTLKFIDRTKPIHFLGIGTVEDLFFGVEQGIDMFDCVTPTRLARVGYFFLKPEDGGKLKNKFRASIKNAAFKNDQKPLSKHCQCWVCKNFSRAYLRYLFAARELTAYTLLSYHNLYYFKSLIDEIRGAILEGKFLALKKRWLK